MPFCDNTHTSMVAAELYVHISLLLVRANANHSWATPITKHPPENEQYSVVCVCSWVLVVNNCIVIVIFVPYNGYM